MTSSATAPGSTRRDAALLAQLRATFVSGVVQAFEAAVAHFDDVLFDRADSAGASRVLYLDGLRELRRRREDMVTRLRLHLEAAWDALEQGWPVSAEAMLAGGGQDGWSLLAEHELESRLAARNLAGAVRREARQLLLRLDRGLGWAAGGLTLDGERDPAGPEHLGVAVHHAFAGSDLAPEVRLVLIKLCERDLTQPVLGLYRALEAQLIGAGAPCEDAEAAAWIDRFASGRTGVRDDGQTVRSARRGVPGADEDDVEAQSALFEALRHLLRRARGEDAARAPATGTAATAGRLSQRETLAVLSLLQATFGAALSDRDDPLAQRLKDEVLSNAVQLRAGPAELGLDPLDEDIIDLVGMVFEVLLDERGLEGRSRDMFRRLLVPFVKAATLDRQMFVQKTHPARRLLNALAEACEGNVGDSPAERVLMGKVEEIVERLVAEFNENLAIFATLEDEFHEFLAQHRRRVEIAERRAAETQRGQEKLDLARQRVQAELQARLSGQTLPQAVDAFLRQPWRHHLTMVVLRDGENSEAMREALALADGVLGALAAARGGALDPSCLQGWQASLRKVFASVGLHEESASAAIGALAETLQAVARARPELERALPELPPMSLPPPVVEPATVDIGIDAGAGEIDPADAEHFRNLPIGTWLDFIDKDGKVQAGKLSWVSPVSARRLFVNRRGVRFCVVSPEEMAISARLGRLQAHARDGAFDSAMQAVIDRLDDNAPVASAAG